MNNPSERFAALVLQVPDRKLQVELIKSAKELIDYVTEGIDTEPNYNRVDFGGIPQHGTTDIFTELGSYFKPQKHIA